MIYRQEPPLALLLNLLLTRIPGRICKEEVPSGKERKALPLNHCGSATLHELCAFPPHRYQSYIVTVHSASSILIVFAVLAAFLFLVRCCTVNVFCVQCGRSGESHEIQRWLRGRSSNHYRWVYFSSTQPQSNELPRGLPE
jgi:hypothetical protein